MGRLLEFGFDLTAISELGRKLKIVHYHDKVDTVT